MDRCILSAPWFKLEIRERLILNDSLFSYTREDIGKCVDCHQELNDCTFAYWVESELLCRKCEEKRSQVY